MSDPTAPAPYSWEATDEQVAARYGLPLDRIVRFDTNTAPRPPTLAAEVLAAGAFQPSLSEYPPADYRRMVEAAAERYAVTPGEILVGAGADEILDLAAKAFLRAGDRAVVASPSYAMFRVVTEQRGASIVAIPRLGSDAGFALDLHAMRLAARSADLIWLCSPNNPTARAEPPGAVEALVEGIAADAAADRRRAPAVVLDEAYAEFIGTSLLPLRLLYPRLIVVRTLSKAYALAGIRVGFGIALRETLAVVEPYRPPGSVSTMSVAVATAALRDPDLATRTVEATSSERERLRAALAAPGWPAGQSDTNFILVAFGSPARAASAAEWLLRSGLVPRTFPSDHELADHLRLTVRSTEENARLIEAAIAFDAAQAGSTRTMR